MKKLFLLNTLLISFLIFSPVKANIIDIDVGDFFFSPVSFDAAVGDTVRWTLVAGTHTTTSTLVPAGAATWDYTFTGAGDSFTYIILVAGVYEYLCSFHPTTMRGSFATPAPLPLLENFEYPENDLLAYHGWVNHSGSGSFVQIFTGSLSFTGYPASGIGNHIQLFGGGGSREDIHRGFENVSSGNLYAAFLVNVDTAEADNGYVAHFMPPIGNFGYRARLFMQDDGAGNLNFGITKGNSGSEVSWVASDFSYDETYLIVIKYEYVGDATGDDDVTKLWVNPDLTSLEPANGDADNIDTASDEVLENFAIRQGGEEHLYQFDGLTIDTLWSQLVPVELTSFTGSVNGSSVTLSWQTATELNNSGFNVERKTENENWTEIAFVQGHGTSNEIHDYAYSDNNLAAGLYNYRIKQIDYDGTFEYSNSVEAEVDLIVPAVYSLHQNYPNPFNPTTTIGFSLVEPQSVTLTIYNAIGEAVATLVNEKFEAGNHQVKFNAENFSSGIYIYRINAGNFTSSKKFILMK